MRTLDSTLRFSGTSQNLSVVTATGAITNGFGTGISDIRVVSTTNCWINIAKTPVATIGAGSMYLPAGVVEYFHVTEGQKVAALRDSADGTLNVSEMTR